MPEEEEKIEVIDLEEKKPIKYRGFLEKVAGIFSLPKAGEIAGLTEKQKQRLRDILERIELVEGFLFREKEVNGTLPKEVIDEIQKTRIDLIREYLRVIRTRGYFDLFGL